MNDELKTTQHSAFSTHNSIVDRSFAFAVRIVKLCRFLEKQDRVSRTLANQLLRSGTSIGANTEEAQAGQSKADFIAKVSIARKEARETHYWLRLLKESEIVPESQLSEIIREADEIIRILTAIVKTSQARNTNDK
jgi:four helix bundle protein